MEKPVPREGTDAYVVSLTSWPPRTGPGPKTPGIWVTLESLMRQNEKPDRIILWLYRGEYPKGLADLPQTLIDLQARGLEIRWVQENTKGLKKLVPALKAGIKANIVTADDDILYTPDWLRRLVNSHKAHPKGIHAIIARHLTVESGVMRPYGYDKRGHHAQKGRYDARWMALNGAGSVYPYDPSQQTIYGLHKRILQPITYGQTTDDLWFYVCRVLAGTPLYLAGCPHGLTYQFIDLPEPLGYMNNVQGQNNVILRRLMKDFPEVAQKLGLDMTKEQCVPPPPAPQKITQPAQHTPAKPTWWQRIKDLFKK